MRIHLAEMRGERKLTTREYNQPVIKFGRDPQRCAVVFDQTEWPMVSRQHAELRLLAARIQLLDLDSKHGTFLNGQRLSQPMEVRAGSRIQLGTDGPLFIVELIEDESAYSIFKHTLVDDQILKAVKPSENVPPSVNVQPKPPLFSVTLVDGQDSAATPEKRAPQVTPRPPTPALNQVRVPELLFESGAPTQLGRKVPLTGERTLLGRDLAAEVSVDAAATAVSRRHAEIRRVANGSYLIADLNSFNGTLVNGQRITQPMALRDGDRIQLGVSGPILRVIDPANPAAPANAASPAPASGLSSAAVHAALPGYDNSQIGMQTILVRTGMDQPGQTPAASASGDQLLFQRPFNGQQRLSVGRAPDNDIRLDGLLISNHHASFVASPQGVLVEDAGSTNGVFLNGARVTGRRPVQTQDIVQIGPFVLKVDATGGIAVFDKRSQTRIDAFGLTEEVRHGSHSTKLLDEVSLAIQPNEFVGVLGPSGAGKSTLIKVLNGRKRATGGQVFVNSMELYQHLDSLKQSLGYVPQEDIIHEELTVYRTLYYVARLRLSRDVATKEIDQIIGEILEVTGLSDRRDVPVSQLSGGQRKRVSIAVELITKPSVLFLDEPTSGLDPATEGRIMKLFRQIAESGRTVILTTHAMENVRLFDRIVVLMRGKLIFYGTPAEALEFVGVNSFIDLYNKLQEPVEAEIAKLEPVPARATKAQKLAHEQVREQIAVAIAEQWQQRFLATELYHRYIWQPLSLMENVAPAASAASRRRGLLDSLRQWTTLVRRYAAVLASDKLNLFILFAQPPIIGLLTYLVVGNQDPRDFSYFILAIVSIWFGTSVAAREIVKERPVYARERMVNLGLVPYVGSKLFVLSLVVGLQSLLLFGTLKLLHFGGLMSLPGNFAGLPQLLIVILTGITGIALGLFISALVKSSNMATSLVPLILIPQILFAGLVGVPTGVAKVLGATMPATWSFDELKRLSTLDTLKEEGSDPAGPNKGRGLYKHVKDLNTENIENTRRQLDDYRKNTLKSVEDQARQTREQTLRPTNSSLPTAESLTRPAVGPAPAIPDAVTVNDDLSDYVSFMHPWGSTIIDPVILIAMLFGLLVAVLATLKIRDAG